MRTAMDRMVWKIYDIYKSIVLNMDNKNMNIEESRYKKNECLVILIHIKS